MTVKLQGIYNKQEAKAVKELKTGDVIMWNYGYSGVFLHLRSFLLILAYSAKRQRHYLRSASVFPSSSTIFVTSAAIFSASSFVTLPVMFPAAS